MARDVKRRDASRVSVTRLNFLRRAERELVKSAGNLLERYEVAEMCSVTIAQVHNYATTGAIEFERVEIAGLPFLFFPRESVEAFIRTFRRNANRMRRQWLDPDFVVAVYDARGLTERIAETKDLSLDEARDVVRGRARRRRELYPAPRGRPKGSGRAEHQMEWLEMFVAKQVELERNYEESRELGLLATGERPPNQMDVAEAVAVDDFALHPERWPDCSPARGDPNALDRRCAESARQRVYMAIKPLLSALKEIQQT
jgi:hypothetical protein